jgi:hypothetical protein
MTAAWMAYLLAVGALLGLAAWAHERASRATMGDTRWSWLVALVATVALGALAPLRMDGGRRDPGVQMVVASPNAAVARTREPTLRERVVHVLLEARGRAVSVAQSVGAAGRSLPAGVNDALALFWLASSGATLGVFALVYLRWRRARDRWPTVVLDGTAVRLAPDVGPAVIGLVDAEIVVPRWLLDRPADERRLVLAHECSHVAADDQLPLLVGCAAVVLLPWHPAVWWMLARLRLAVELDCDRRVIRAGAPPRAYGSLLIALASRGPAFPVGALALAERRTHLERRLVAMTTRRTRFAALRTAPLLAVVVVASLAACEARLPTSAEVEKMDVAGAERALAASPLRRTFGDSVTAYYIDGRRATPAQMDALGSARIASIEVRKVNGQGEVRVTTRAAGDTGTSVRVQLSSEAMESARQARGTKQIRMRSVDSVSMKIEVDTVVVHGIGQRASSTIRVGGGPDERKTFSGLVVIDGVRSDAAAMARLGQDDIVSVEVLKGSAARARYTEPEAANGVILVTTRKASPQR